MVVHSGQFPNFPLKRNGFFRRFSCSANIRGAYKRPELSRNFIRLFSRIGGMINLVWGSNFKQAYKSVVVASPHLKPKVTQELETFTDNPHHPSLRTHRRSGKLRVCGLSVWLTIAG